MEPLRIGTRDSRLALWQAEQVAALLHSAAVLNDIVPVKSDGDIDLRTPLYEMGVQGIFTRSLDIALLQGKIDIAVHSMKDVPTALPDGIVQAAVLERGNHKDLLVFHPAQESIDLENGIHTIATSSIRRSAQWLYRFPHHTMVNLRGNVNTRMQKLSDSDWQGAIFAAAGLERIGLKPSNSVELDWMLSAPAQGAIMVVCRENDQRAREVCMTFNHQPTEICTGAEREFLRELMGGCTMPISARACLNGDNIEFHGSILTVDGKKKAEVKKNRQAGDYAELGKIAAKELLQNGGMEIIKTFRNVG
jgi:hydroxymethylbilane synthase